MADSNSSDNIIHKEVIIIGNGPSGISLSMMLSGRVAHVMSTEHPDELLAARLRGTEGSVLATLPLQQLAAGLEGRATNPAALLYDCLERPHADLGLEMPPLVAWCHTSHYKIDHLVLGKGPPGGSWHTMDPNILTLSLGSWMSLPGYPYNNQESTDSQRRASAGSIAQYYASYVEEMGLTDNFCNGIQVTRIEAIKRSTNRNKPIENRLVNHKNLTEITEDFILNHKKCKTDLKKLKECDSYGRKCTIFNAINYIRCRTKYFRQKSKENRSNRRSRDSLKMEVTPEHDYYEFPSFCGSENFCLRVNDFRANFKVRSQSFSYDEPKNVVVKSKLDKRNSVSDINVKCECGGNSELPSNKWLVHAQDLTSGKQITFSCDYLVLANGACDIPNKLELPVNSYNLPWVLHDLRSLEMHLDNFMGENPDPILVVGAGLSAADAVIATRFRSIPVLHVFRNRSGLDKQLPENMYPEYHKVHQMMMDGGSTYPLYTALPEHSITDISQDKTVTLVSSLGEELRFKISYVVVLIGSRPDLHFLPQDWCLGVNKTTAVDSKSNPVHINKLNHSVIGQDNLYAIGPLAGDNFVRFIPGGALAVVADLYKKKGL